MPGALFASEPTCSPRMPDASHATPLPFPDDVPLDVALLQAGDEHEIDRLWKAVTKLGFWYLTVPMARSMQYSRWARIPWRYLSRRIRGSSGATEATHSDQKKKRGTSLPAIATDASGALDSAEFIDVSYDDALAFPTVVHRRYPCVVEERMDSARPFVRKSMEANQTLIDVLNDRLGLPPGCLSGLHGLQEHSGSEARCIKKTPASTPEAPDKAAIGAHTDFGSLSFLHIRLGGLQVLPPGTDEWKYVKPMPGHAICNLGDAMAILSAGVLRSNLHRVVPPPKAQASFDRWSLAFFTRPMNSVPLAPLVKESPLIAEAAAGAPEGRYATGSTAGEWFRRRVQNRRIMNQRGTETWMASRGTERQGVY